MGLDYHIFKPKEALSLSNALGLIQSISKSAVRNEFSEHFIDFSLNIFEKFPDILKAFQLKGNKFHLTSPEYSCAILDYIPIVENDNLYNHIYINSSGHYEENKLGFFIQIDNENLDLKFDIGLPFADLKLSKQLLCNLIRHLLSEGIYLGMNNYDDIEKYIDQLINLNSDAKPSFTWQLNISDFSLKHNNSYMKNTNYGSNEKSSYRMGGIRVGFPAHYFKHKNLKERDKLNFYSSRLLVALSKYFDDSCKINFASSNLDLLKSLSLSNKNNFKLSAKIDLKSLDKSVSPSEIRSLFETGNNEYSLSSIKLNIEHEFFCTVSIKQEDDDPIQLRIYSDYKIDKEEEYKRQIEEELNLKLAYIGAE